MRDNIKCLIGTIFKMLGLYEKIKENENDEVFTKENFIVYIEKTLVDMNALISFYQDDEIAIKILEKCKLSTMGILEMIKSGKDDHKMIKSKVLDMTNDISRYLEE